ncbi:hypothetical protein [Lacisediminimonas sp.]|uniref:hypothetical protein n=1 Tax=Lacisediminimonas sp. TaxID=3060582 RepID=UPI002725B401|nr:hypothetical protein [Lacisediminimonas sp.]MDO8301137.1 hypothetical protein [Lacisediminimonas sp.]MDO9216439.1 hypothetical protein [Lacisediminimonas sp.]
MSPIAATEALQEFFQTENLPVPPLPAALMQALVKTGPHSWSTRSDDSSPEDIDLRIEEAQANIADYAEIGFSGHGINSWVMHCNVVTPSLALFLQCRWGNAYDDAERARLRIEGVISFVGMLLDDAEKATARGALPAKERLVVFFSDHAPSRWQWRSASDAWNQDGDFTLLGALAALRERIDAGSKKK